MAKTLAELRESRLVSKPERVYPLCLAQALVAEYQSLTDERAELAMARRPSEDGPQKPSRLGQPEDVRVTEIEVRLDALYEEMREHTGQLRLRAQEFGDWVTWRDANPARRDGVDDEGRPVLNAVDVAVAYSWCNASALLENLGKYMVQWNDEPMTDEDREFIIASAAPGDLKALVSLIVEMHEGTGSRAPKASSRRSSTNTPNEIESELPEPSGSPSAAS